MKAVSAPLLEVTGLRKSFSGVTVLDGVQLTLHAGEVHGLMGENGAGKSTLLKILAGLIAPDAGEIRLNGELCRFESPQDAIAAGIAMIHQELMPFPELTAAENIFIGREPAGRFPGTVDRPKMHADAAALLRRLGTKIAPDRRLRDLSVSETQVIEIAKALVRSARIIIMDEPTSSLAHHETEALFRLIEELRRSGVAVIYVSHKMDEIFRLASRVTVLRDGRQVATERIEQLDEPTLVKQMVGRAVTLLRREGRAERGEEVLAVKALSRRGKFADISFRVHRGEVLGLAGLMGAGRTEVVSAIYGLRPADDGVIAVHGKEVPIGSPADAMRLGLGFVSEDRKQIGLVPAHSVKHNLTLGGLARCCRGGVIQAAAENEAVEECIRRYGVKTAGRDQPVVHLSGGNQQKVVVAKVLFTEPEILILDEPTRGIDIGAKQEIYAMIADWAREGRAIILVSSELPELIALSDRVLVMRAGRIVAELTAGELAPESILRHAMPN